MNRVIADLQIHSKYSRAVSPQMIIPQITRWAEMKSIGLMATGDWTHPLWFKELQLNLEENGDGFYRMKNSQSSVRFLLSGEVSCIYSQGGRLRRIHTLIFAPDLSTADKINKELVKRGCNLMSDGRPIIGLTSIQLAETVFGVSEKCLIIPAHAWTPWFSLYGSMSGFDSIDEAFGKYADRIYGIETGLSSDPAMNWRIKELDHRTILSFSDAHSGPKVGREATVFDLQEFTYDNLYQAISLPDQFNRVDFTVEFYPEEGKYHYTGHRNCNVVQSPLETKTNGSTCPVCGKPLTVGVMHRVEVLAGRSENDLRLFKKNIPGTKVLGIYSQAFPKAPYIKLVPLQEILAEALMAKTGTEKVQSEYEKITKSLGGEFNVLLNSSTEEISAVSGEKVAEGIKKVQDGEIVIDPGYDGVFGVVKIWGEEKDKLVKNDNKQLGLF